VDVVPTIIIIIHSSSVSWHNTVGKKQTGMMMHHDINPNKKRQLNNGWSGEFYVDFTALPQSLGVACSLFPIITITV